MIILASIAISVINFIIQMGKIFRNSSSLKASMWEYILMSISLSGGFLPQVMHIMFHIVVVVFTDYDLCTTEFVVFCDLLFFRF
jgi:hypothetical protein